MLAIIIKFDGFLQIACRPVIGNTLHHIPIACNDVWMTAWEIGELFNVTTTAVNAAIRAILKTDVLNDFEVCRYVRLENGLNADVYSLEIIIPIAFRLNTYYTHVFRSWLLRKAYAKEQKDTYMLFVPIAKGGHC